MPLISKLAELDQSVTILGIESSCDDTGAAVLKGSKVLSNVIAGQKVHVEYGGVVPELASRAHQQNIIPVVDSALKKARVNIKEIDAIAFTRGPGLMGSLLVGTSFAKGLALGSDIPLIEVNHMQAHIHAHFIDEGQPVPSFPFLCLTVSGGHTQLVRSTSTLEMEVLGTTIDDAAGEAFDKAAKIMGLPYPGGPLIDEYATKGNPHAFTFTKPNIPDLNFSFSGLKTAFLYFVRKEVQKNEHFIKENLNGLCASIQRTIVEILMDKLKTAAEQTGIKEIAMAGGVSANSALRNALQQASVELGWNIYVPKEEYCTDNAAMIAMSGYFKYVEGMFATQAIAPAARLPF